MVRLKVGLKAAAVEGEGATKCSNLLPPPKLVLSLSDVELAVADKSYGAKTGSVLGMVGKSGVCSVEVRSERQSVRETAEAQDQSATWQSNAVLSAWNDAELAIA